MKYIFATAMLAAVTLADAQDDFEFMQFCSKNNKSYLSAGEWKNRENLWLENSRDVAKLNAKANGKATFALNAMSDMTDAEKAAHLGFNAEGLENAPKNKKFKNGKKKGRKGRKLSDENINWVDRGNTTPVKDQGYCGSCTCFAATTALEAMQSISSGQAPVRLSEQQGLDCTDTSCDYGGWQQWFFDFARTGGVNTASDYPYESYNGNDYNLACRNDSSTATAFVDEVYNITYAYDGADVENIRAALEYGPLTIALRAGNNVFMQYNDGIITKEMSDAAGCSGYDHAVVIVGYEQIGGETTTVVTEDWSQCETTTEDYSRCEYSWTDYSNCPIITDEVTSTRTRCRRARGYEIQDQECTRFADTRDEWYREITNRRGRTKRQCCREEVTVIQDEIIDPDCPGEEQTWTDPTCEPEITTTRIEGCEPETSTETITTDAMQVWVVQNSWDTWWGDNGFVRMEAVDGEGTCGMNFWTQLVTVS